MQIHTMVDIESLGVRPGSTVLSIGALSFYLGTKEFEVISSYHRIVSRTSCRWAGLVEDPDTLEWWGQQTEEARKTLVQATEARVRGNSLSDVLLDFSEWMGEPTTPAWRPTPVWTNGPAMDAVLLVAAAEKVGLPPPWSYRLDRDYRTLVALADAECHAAALEAAEHRFPGELHNALVDAQRQAYVVWALYPSQPLGRAAAGEGPPK